MKISKKMLKESFSRITGETVSITKKLFYIFRNSRIALFTVALIFSIFATVLFSGITVAYNVEYNGDVIAQIKNKEDYSRALELAKGVFFEGELENYTYSPSFYVTVTTKKRISSASDVAISIIEKTDSINKGTALKIDGTIYCCVSEEVSLKEYIDNYLNSYVQGEEVVSSFVENVECVDGYYPDNSFVSLDSVKEKISTLNIKTVQTLRSQKAIPYTSVTRKSSSRVLGDIYKAVTGVNGVSETVEEIEMLNGKIVKTNVIYENVLKEPVQEVVVVGTRRDTSVSSTYISQLNCIWPLKRVEGQTITSYYGDGRNHKGIDIGSKTGTPIYAVQSGTVIVSSYDKGYGYYVVISHAGGYKTFYAHCEKLLVNVGETVSQGQVIALVGNTGRSTGSHLHFEIEKDGVKLNPAPFVGL